MREQPVQRLSQPATGRARQAPAPHRRSLRPRHLRGHRGPVPQEAHACGLRPGQPRPAAARVRARRLRPARLGGAGLQPGRLRGGPVSTPGHPSGSRSGGSCPRASGSCPGTSRDDDAFDELARTIQELDESRGTGGNHAFYMSIPPKFFPDVTKQLARSGPGGAGRRAVAAGRHREAVRSRPQVGARAQRGGRVRLPAGLGVPDRPLPRQGDGPEPPGAPVREPDVRARLERELRRPRADHDGRGHRHRRPGRLLRRHRRGPRRHPEPPPAAARPDRHGGAGLVRGA